VTGDLEEIVQGPLIGLGEAEHGFEMSLGKGQVVDVVSGQDRDRPMKGDLAI
jgi:hypothetical protein